MAGYLGFWALQKPARVEHQERAFRAQGLDLRLETMSLKQCGQFGGLPVGVEHQGGQVGGGAVNVREQFGHLGGVAVAVE